MTVTHTNNQTSTIIPFEDLSFFAWKIYRTYLDKSFIVKPSIPILFFGDLKSYINSKYKIITVGLNPSLIEFPTDEPSLRFEIPNNIPDRDYSSYISSLNKYFHNHPYSRWFSCFEPMLNGLNASFYPGGQNIALHTDICSPLATNPTWSKLGKFQKAILEPSGVELWHKLIEILQPDIILISVSKQHLNKIRYEFVDNWKRFYTISRNKPYYIDRALIKVKEKKVVVFYGPAAQTPFGTISKSDKIKVGKFIRENIYGR